LFPRAAACQTTVVQGASPEEARRLFRRMEELIARSPRLRCVPPSTTAPVAAAVAPLDNGIAKTAYTCGWASLVTICLGPIGFTLALTAIVCGVVGIQKANEGAPHRDKAVVGLVVGAVVLMTVIAGMIVMALNPQR